MHFALPPRKTSHPPPYARAAAARNSSERRRKLCQLGSYIVLGVLTIYLILHYAFSSPHTGMEEIERIPSGTAPVVIVTVLDEEHMSPAYIQKIKANREDYASRHGAPPRLLYRFFPQTLTPSLLSRLHQLLHERNNLRSPLPALPTILVPRTRTPPRSNPASARPLVPLSLPTLPHHQRHPLSPIPHPQPPRVPHAQRHPSCAP